MTRLLLLEDSIEYQDLVRSALHGMAEIKVATSVHEAKGQVEAQDFDLFLLEMHLPDGSGAEFCADLKANPRHRNAPVILLSEKSGIADKVAGFSLGADDYLVKPFHPIELRMRIQAHMRRSGHGTQDVLEKGPFRISRITRKVLVSEGGKAEVIVLTPNEFGILDCLVSRESQVMSREQLLDLIWGNDVHVVDRMVDRHVCSLRRKLKEHSIYIQTVPQSGYRFTIRPLEMN